MTLVLLNKRSHTYTNSTPIFYSALLLYVHIPGCVVLWAAVFRNAWLHAQISPPLPHLLPPPSHSASAISTTPSGTLTKLTPHLKEEERSGMMCVADSPPLSVLICLLPCQPPSLTRFSLPPLSTCPPQSAHKKRRRKKEDRVCTGCSLTICCCFALCCLPTAAPSLNVAPVPCLRPSQSSREVAWQAMSGLLQPAASFSSLLCCSPNPGSTLPSSSSHPLPPSTWLPRPAHSGSASRHRYTPTTRDGPEGHSCSNTL